MLKTPGTGAPSVGDKQALSAQRREVIPNRTVGIAPGLITG